MPDRRAQTRGTIDAAIGRAISFLRSRQLPHGEFVTLLAADPSLSGGIHDSSPFVTAQVLHALTFVRRDAVADLVDRAAGFLESDVGAGGVWRYYSSRNWKHRRVPPDLDDTAMASLALRRSGHTVPANTRVIRDCLDATHRYRTWVSPIEGSPLHLRLLMLRNELHAWRRTPAGPAVDARGPRFDLPTDSVDSHDVDPVVNANVLAFLAGSQVHPATVQWIARSAAHALPGAFSRYYHDPLALYHAVARAHGRGVEGFVAVAPAIVAACGQRADGDGGYETALATALAAGTLATLAGEVECTARAVEALLNLQRPDGGWDGHALYSGPVEFWGSDELTTGLAIESLATFRAIGA